MTCTHKDTPEQIAEARAAAAWNGRFALAIRLRDRYFVKFVGDKVITAWSITGATLFTHNDTYRFGQAEKKLAKLGREWERLEIGIVGITTR